MQSCPRCGAHALPEHRSCQWCGLPLSPATGPAPNRIPETTPLGQSLRDFSPNGNVPQAAPHEEPPGSGAAHPGSERWGDFWGPGTPPASDTPPAVAGPAQPTTGQPPQPPTLREYGSGVPPGPYSPYRPPGAPAGAVTPGYPGVPPGAHAYPGYASAPGYAAYPAYPGMPGYPYGWYPLVRPPRAPGETYHKVLSILTIIAASLLLIGGLGDLVITALVSLVGLGEDLSVITLLLMGGLVSLAGGGAGLYHAIRALMRRPSAPFSLPSFWLLLSLTALILGTGIALLALKQPTGYVALMEPLVLLSGIVPALTVLALGLQRLSSSVSWRRAWLSLTCGATLGVAAAILLELVLTLALLGVASTDIDLSTLSSDSSFGTIAFLILGAVIAPLVEETTKQIGGFFLLPRLKGAQEAFLVGLAAGIGFDIVETAGYIGNAQADWVGIAFGRVGAGLLHGVGAAMAGVGWYYLFKGKGTRGRWRIAIGFLVYAYVQHAVFNGGQIILLLQIPSLQTWHIDFFGLRLDITIVFAGVLYLIIVGIMLLVTRWLRRAAPSAAGTSASRSLAPRVSPATYSSRAAAASTGDQPGSPAPTDTLGVGEPGSKEPGGTL